MSIAHLTSDALRVLNTRYLCRNPDGTIAESPNDLFFREAQMEETQKKIEGESPIPYNTRQVVMQVPKDDGITFYRSDLP